MVNDTQKQRLNIANSALDAFTTFANNKLEISLNVYSDSKIIEKIMYKRVFC